MNISKYEVFLKTIELGSLTKAAEALGYTQSGITHILNALENDCGLKLLVRDRSGVSITSDGQQLLPYFQSICHQQHSLSMKIKELHRMESGLIRIGTFTSVSAQWLPFMISRFRKDYPKIQFELLHGTNIQNEEWLLNGRLDCAFVRIPANKNLDATFLRRDPLVAVLPENHVLSDSSVFPIASLSQYPYIMLYEGVEDEISEVFKIHHITPDVQFMLQDDYAVITMVEKGLGFSILPELVLKNNAHKIIIKALEVPFYRDLGIAVKDKSMLSATTQLFLSYVKAWILEVYPA